MQTKETLFLRTNLTFLRNSLLADFFRFSLFEPRKLTENFNKIDARSGDAGFSGVTLFLRQEKLCFLVHIVYITIFIKHK
jgi:hypothetical protein